MARQARWHYTVEHIRAQSYHFQKLDGRADPHYIARFVERQPRRRRDLLHHLLFGLADADSADCVPGEIKLREAFCAVGSDAVVAAALHDSERQNSLFG